MNPSKSSTEDGQARIDLELTFRKDKKADVTLMLVRRTYVTHGELKPTKHDDGD